MNKNSKRKKGYLGQVLAVVMEIPGKIVDVFVEEPPFVVVAEHVELCPFLLLTHGREPALLVGRPLRWLSMTVPFNPAQHERFVAVGSIESEDPFVLISIRLWAGDAVHVAKLGPEPVDFLIGAREDLHEVVLLAEGERIVIASGGVLDAADGAADETGDVPVGPEFVARQEDPDAVVGEALLRGEDAVAFKLVPAGFGVFAVLFEDGTLRNGDVAAVRGLSEEDALLEEVQELFDVGFSLVAGPTVEGASPVAVVEEIAKLMG